MWPPSMAHRVSTNWTERPELKPLAETIDGGNSNDVINAHGGDGSITPGNGPGEGSGGAGDDTIDRGLGPDAISGDVDVLDLSGAGNYTIEYTGPENGFINFLNEQGHVHRSTEFKEIERINCFTPGTGIATMQGQRAVEDLRVGDRVFTRDNGAQKIRWIGRKKISLGAGTLSQKLQPILIRSGALGHGLPERDTLVSPNHRLLLTSKRAQLYFGESEVLVAAKHLVGKPGFEHWITAKIEYMHFLCDHHEIVLSNGAWSDTLQPSDFSLAGLGEPQRQEIYRLFPELKSQPQKSKGHAASRRSLKLHEAQLLRD